MPLDAELDLIARQFRENPSLLAKASIQLVTDMLGKTDWLAGPGDDAAVVRCGSENLLAAGEAIFPPFVASDPHGAGVAAVLTNVNDIAAMGGQTLAIVDTIVGPEEVARRALEGMREAAALYGVPIVGGHLTVRPGPPALSAFALGRAERPLSARQAAPDGEMRRDFPFFSAVARRGPRMRDDVGLLAEAAERGLCVAAKDVSMAGLLGSLAMLLEPNRLGCAVQLERVPQPSGVGLAAWLQAFPSFGFLLCAPPEQAVPCERLFRHAGLACDVIGQIDRSGTLRARLGDREAVLLDLATERVTGLRGPDTPPHLSG